MNVWTLLIAIALLLATPRHALTAPKGDDAVTEDLCRQATNPAQKKQTELFYFGDMASMREETPEAWRAFRSAKERESAATDDNLYTTADVTLLQGRILLVKFMFTSPSGDWAHYVDACYRPDGTLARIVADLRTFNGNIRVVRTIHFSPQGKEIKRQTTFYDLNSGKKQQPSPGSFQDQEPTIFLRTQELPFFPLLQRGGN
jgi:hypothetical protein